MKKLQLKRLAAYGFKSFADKAEIEFDKGITAIVGPNGSGKSNITDAVRWVLGEQNIRALRGIKSEDIIFTGSATRRALGVAEVTLTLLNEGTLPIDFNEVEIKRRFFRSGESEYYINQTRCRLKDIYALFADTGLGQDGMSVISQNNIDEILNSKPEERRLFFEETAGITKYRLRKKEAMSKLDAAEQNYLRVQDIMHEIETELEPLSEQAEKTRRYNELKGEYRRCRITELVMNYERFITQKEKFAAQIAEVKDKELETSTQKSSAEAQKEENNRELLRREDELRELSSANLSLHEEVEAAASEIRLFEERNQQRDSNQKRLNEEKQSLVEKLAADTDEREEIKSEAKLLAEKQSEFALELERAKKRAGEISKTIKEERQKYEESNKARENLQETLSEREKEYALLLRDIEADIEQSKLKNKSQDEINAVLADKRKSLTKTEEELKSEAAKKAELTDEEKKLSGRQKKLLEETNRSRQLAGSAKQYAEQAEAKLELLKKLQQEYDGFGKSVKAVLKSKANWRGNVCGAVAELIDVKPEHITAVDVALGAAAQNIVTTDAQTAKLAILFLKSGSYGRATFLPLDSLLERDNPDISVRGAGIIGWLNNLVSTDEKYKKAVDFLLSRTLLVDNLDNALALAKKNKQRLRIVTLEGELLNPGGSISGGSHKQSENGFLNRSGEIVTLNAAKEKKEAEAREHLTKYNELKDETERVNTRIATIREELGELSLREAKLRFEAGRASEIIAEQERKLAELKEWQTRRELTFAKSQERKLMTAGAIEKLVAEIDKAKEETGKLRQKVAELEREATEQAKTVNDAERENAVLEQGVLRHKEKALLLSRTIEQTERDIESKEKELNELLAADEKSAFELEKLKKTKEERELKYAESLQKQQELYDARMKAVVDGQELDKKIAELAQRLTKLGNKTHSIELELSGVDFELAQCVKHMDEDFSLTPELAKAEKFETDENSLIKMMRELQEEIASLGAVNPQAVEEYENRKNRYEFLKRQMTDLTEAKQNLMRLVKDINATMTERFVEAFGKIKIAFNEIFSELFGGGTANVFLTDEKDVLNSGVEITVRLPEKRQQNLSALSGGERALTVIALLFAFLRCKPAAFSVLDEIDAALDEANIGRFSKFLHSFAENTQFIIVTHRKKTMEAADVIYGVTIEDAGVSKLLSVRLDNK